VRIGKRLLDVASSFFEIERDDKPAEDAKAAAKQPNGAVTASNAEAEPKVENELDAYMHGMEAQGESAVATTETTEAPEAETPVVVAEDPIVEEPAEVFPEDTELTQDLMVAIAEDGTVDFERIFRSSQVPTARFTAEQAVNMLTALPENLPIAIKRKTVKATLDALGSPMGAAPEAIAQDATLKKDSLTNYLNSVVAQADEISGQATAEIEQLEAERAEVLARIDAALAEHQARKAAVEEKRAFAWDSCRRQIGLMDEVVVFFQENLEEPVNTAPVRREVEPEEEYADGELPPHLANDTAYRLLGITGEAPSLQQLADQHGLDIDVAAVEAAAENLETMDKSTRRPRRRRNGAEEGEADTPIPAEV
jgi:hypothetical protein